MSSGDWTLILALVGPIVGFIVGFLLASWASAKRRDGQ